MVMALIIRLVVSYTSRPYALIHKSMYFAGSTGANDYTFLKNIFTLAPFS